MNAPLVGITHRVVNMTDRNETWDALDQAWTMFLSTCGMEAIPVANKHPDPVAFLSRFGVCRIILTGGNNLSSSLRTLDGSLPEGLPVADDLAPDRDTVEASLLRASIEQDWAVIGVCRGMQAMNVFHGGRIRAIKGHVGVNHAITREHQTTDPSGAPIAFESPVNSFHRFAIGRQDLAPGFKPLAWESHTIEAFAHPTRWHFGIMWHPERNDSPTETDVMLFRQVFARGTRL